MNIILPLDPQIEEYSYISRMSKEEMIFALKNYVPKQVLGYPITYQGYCPNCKKEVNRLDYFCSKCGKALRHISQ